MIAPVIAMVLVFATDMVGKQSLKGRMQVLAYSAVSVIKERVELYGETNADAIDGKVLIDSNQATMVYNIVKDSMERTMIGFDDRKMGYAIEQYKVDGETNKVHHTTKLSDNNITCQPDKTLDKMKELHIKTSWNRPVSLYQVTFCYQDTNAFGDLIGGNYSMVKASAIMLGR